MRPWLLVFALVTIMMSVPQDSQAADCHYTTVTVLVQGKAQNTSTWVCTGVIDSGTTTGGSDGPTDLDRDPICVSTAIAMGIPSAEFCDEKSDDEARETITPGLVKTAVQNIPLPAALIQVQPPNGRTLVNFDSNFFTVVDPVDVPIRLSGHQVDIQLAVTEYAWHFGDGVTEVGDNPGAPFPALDVTHAYLRKGKVSPLVDATWTGRYQVDGGPWLAIPGSVTVPGSPVDLQVVTATPTLVGYQ